MNRLIQCRSYSVGLLALFFIFQSSCTKTEYLEYEQETLTRILEYRVTNAQQELLGAIDQEHQTITVYVPYYLAIDYLNAEIKLDEGASLWDEAGNEINLDGGLDPVPLGDTVTYTVKSITGTERTYTLIQEILPYPEPLDVRYGEGAENVDLLELPVHIRWTIIGNFASTSTNAKFYLTDRATGEVHDDWVTAYSVTPGDEYNMQIDISPEAIAGEYDVEIEHQGRRATLPPLKLRYQRPVTQPFLSSARYAPGDTIVFNTRQGTNPFAKKQDASVFVGVKRVYVKVIKNTGAYPEEFTEDMFDKPIPMEIVSWNRTELKAIFPDMPAGVYFQFFPWYNDGYNTTEDGPTYFIRQGLGFYADYDEQTNWGDDVIFGFGYQFTVLPKP